MTSVFNAVCIFDIMQSLEFSNACYSLYKYLYDWQMQKKKKEENGKNQELGESNKI